jgi:hypothetical protein
MADMWGGRRSGRRDRGRAGTRHRTIRIDRPTVATIEDVPLVRPRWTRQKPPLGLLLPMLAQ